jgi:hypothetical protein
VAAQIQPAHETAWLRAVELGRGPYSERGHALGYDEGRGRVVFLGPDLTRTQPETWEWDGFAWSRLAPLHRPRAVSDHALAYDARRGAMLLFGGRDASGAALDETWAWDGQDWRQLTPTGGNPPARADHAMAVDRASGSIVLFGGWGAAGLLGDTWQWDGSGWTQQFPRTNPDPRAAHAMASAPGGTGVLIFGGIGPGCGWIPALDDTWEWRGADWHRRATTGSPHARYRHAMALDLARDRVVLFGGEYTAPHVNHGPPPPRINFGETWQWDGRGWHVSLDARDPSARVEHSIAFDGARQSLIMLGGFANAWNPGYGQLTTPDIGSTWLHGDLAPAATHAFGDACGGGSYRLELSSAAPRLGTPNFALWLRGAPPSQTALFAFSSTQAATPLGSCTLYLEPPLLLDSAPIRVTGTASTAVLSVPRDPLLRGTSLYAQAFALDASTAPSTLSASPALRLLFGD